MSSHEQFQAALARYYKAERDRSEQCLGDIIEIVSVRDVPMVCLDAILDRLVKHYTR